MPRAAVDLRPLFRLPLRLRCQWCNQLFDYRLGKRLYIPKCCSKGHASRLAHWGRQHPRVVQ